MAWVNARRLAAADMWGTAGSRRRRQVIRAEFFAGVGGCLLVGAITIAQSTGWAQLVGVWLVGAGVNYIPLAIHAQALSRSGALEAELRGTDVRRELHRAGVRQLWIAVPFAIAISDIVGRYRGRRLRK
jgi:hypothetical protein